MIYLNNRNLIQKSIDIQDYIVKVLFNQNNSKAVIVHNNNENNFFSIWNITEQQQEFQIQSQNLVVDSLYLDMKKFLIVSQEQGQFTHFSIYSTDQQKVINQWKGKYINNHMNSHYNRDNQLLVIDFYFEYEHYIQIWSLHNFNLIKQLHNEISFLDIIEIQGKQFYAVVEASRDDQYEMMMIVVQIQMILYCKMNSRLLVFTI